MRDLAGIDAVTGEAASIARGYVLHRIDLETVRVLDARAARCDQDHELLRELVAAFSDPDELVCDPYDGGGTTGIMWAL